ncbi:hypothetical protein [Enterococcus gilvus]|uniref:hypothetical protein n=1 Tax=Enterococcus gilvus TaxID=160453 RepID=UPI001C8B163F|nr:hypothetical protein [Enterococcus gilvus]MBX8938499.1 hypothetical protein [Enterococcus gilvus]
MWDFLDKFNAITGFFMFFITGINLFVSWRISNKINSAVDIHRLKLDKKQLKGKINSIIRVIDLEKDVSNENKDKILIFLTELRADFPDIKKLNQKKLIKLIESDDPKYLDVREALVRLITEIERIA